MQRTEPCEQRALLLGAESPAPVDVHVVRGRTQVLEDRDQVLRVDVHQTRQAGRDLRNACDGAVEVDLDQQPLLGGGDLGVLLHPRPGLLEDHAGRAAAVDHEPQHEVHVALAGALDAGDPRAGGNPALAGEMVLDALAVGGVDAQRHARALRPLAPASGHGRPRRKEVPAHGRARARTSVLGIVDDAIVCGLLGAQELRQGGLGVLAGLERTVVDAFARGEEPLAVHRE